MPSIEDQGAVPLMPTAEPVDAEGVPMHKLAPATQVGLAYRPSEGGPHWRNVTFRLEESVLFAARVRALRERGSLNGVIHDYLEAYGGVRVPDGSRPLRRIPRYRGVRTPSRH